MDTVFVRIGKKLSTSETYDPRGLAGDFGFFLKRVETKETIKETTRIRAYAKNGVGVISVPLSKGEDQRSASRTPKSLALRVQAGQNEPYAI